MKDYYGLADCNNFYASCESAFNPQLINRPVAVLSNNDGCIVARSKELKALNIPMSTPYWKCKDILKKHHAAVLSSNYRLYADMSERVMTLLEEAYMDIEIYSIDEAFIKINELTDEAILKYSQQCRKHILRSTGIPISIGFGTTKTLAKLANKIAKGKYYEGPGVYIITPTHPILDQLSVDKVWGINKGFKARLNNIGIQSIRDFMQADKAIIQKKLGVLGLRMQYELNGHPCHALSEAPTQRKHIMVSRTFKTDVRNIPVLQEAVSQYTARAAEKLRDCKQTTYGISVFIKSNPFKNRPYVKLFAHKNLPIATSDTSLLITAAKQILTSIYDNRFMYKKIGVSLYDLRPQNPIQTHLFTTTSLAEHSKRSQIMRVMDQLNNQFGKGTMRLASYTHDINHLYKKEKQSKEFTTNWDELIISQ